MAIYIILSRFSQDAYKDPKDLLKAAGKVSEKIKEECPRVVWKESFKTLGRYDVADVVESDDPKQVDKAVMIIRGSGHASVEVLQGTPWKAFLAEL